MPTWLEILFGAIPGVLGLVGALWRMGEMHNELRNIVERIAPVPQMAQDIAYLKGRLDGTDVERLSGTGHRTPRARKVSAVAANHTS
jgi:hypothetical protein